jgi:hypothetical protein
MMRTSCRVLGWFRFPVMALAEQAGLSDLVTEHVKITAPPIVSTGTNPAGKISSIIAGMAAGADSIDDLDVLVRHEVACCE